jgi:hypothetical protein
MNILNSLAIKVKVTSLEKLSNKNQFSAGVNFEKYFADDAQ